MSLSILKKENELVKETVRKKDNDCKCFGTRVFHKEIIINIQNGNRQIILYKP